MTDMNQKGSKICKTVESMFNTSERKNVDNHWCELAEYITDNLQGTINTNTYSKGTKKISRNVYDSTAIQANKDLAAAIHSTLTNPSTKWSKIRFKAEDLNNDPDAVSWLEKANMIIHDTLNESNFDTQVSRAYQDYPAFGNMVLMHEAPNIIGRDANGNPEYGSHKFSAVHLGHVAWDENKDGRVNRIGQKLRRTPSQILEQWPKTSPDFIKEAHLARKDEEYIVVQYIWERDPKEVKLNDLGLAPGKHRPFGVVYALEKDGTILEESGFYEFPFYVVRWQTIPGEKYGKGPGATALPDVRTLNKLVQFVLQGTARAINPPILANQRDVLGAMNLRPGHVNVVKDVQGVREMQTTSRFDISQFEVQDYRNTIRNLFLLDKLLLPPRTETGEMTAFEIAERTDQMQRVLGPTLSRLNSEFLTPLVLRTFKVLLRHNQLPPLPDILKERGVDVDIVFVNQLARSQQIQEVQTISQWIQGLSLMAQMNAEVLDVVDFDGAALQMAKVLGVPEIAIKNVDEVQQIREQRAQQLQQQQALEAGVQAADIASKTGGLDNG